MLRPVPCSAFRAPSYLCHHHVDQIVGERLVLADLGRRGEALAQDEVEVAVQGVAEMIPSIAVLAGRALELQSGLGETRSTGKVMSSMITVVPVVRTAPTEGKRPLRMFHSRSPSSAVVVKESGWSSGLPAMARSTAWIFHRSLPPRPPAPPPGGRRVSASARRAGGMPCLSSTERRDARSITSAAATPAARRWGMASHGLPMSAKSRRALDLQGSSSTVS